MWTDLVWHVAPHILADSTNQTGGSGGGNGGDGDGPSTTLIVGLAGAGSVLAAGFLGYLSNGRRTRKEESDKTAEDKQAGAIEYRVGQLEAHREDEQEARDVMDRRIAELEGRMVQVEHASMICPVPPAHPARQDPTEKEKAR